MLHKFFVVIYIMNKVAGYIRAGVRNGLQNFRQRVPLSDDIISSFENYIIEETLEDLKTFKNGNTLPYINYQIERIVNAIKNSFVEIPGSSPLRIINKTKTQSKPPWFIIKYPKTGIVSDVIFQEIDIPGMAEPLSDSVTWKLRWEKDISMDTLPSATTQTVKQRTNSITQQKVGKYCNSQTFKSQNPWCEKKKTFKYNETYNPSTNQSVIIKSGKSGLGVLELSKLLFSISDQKKRRRYYLDLKRNGDYGQIFSCRYLMEDDPQFYKAIMHPGSRKLGEFLLKGEGSINDLRNIMNNGSFFFMNATFCSFDRPAAKLAQLMRIPVLYEKTLDKRCYFQVVMNYQDIGGLTTQPTTKPLVSSLTGSDIINIVNYLYIQSNGALPRQNYYPMWYQLMCIIDTAHDFRGPRLPKSATNPRGPRTAIKDLMAGLYTSGGTIQTITTPYGRYNIPDLITVIFNKISDIEEAGSNDLVRFSRMYSTAPIPPPGQRFPTSCGASFAMQGNETTSTLNNPRNSVTTLDDLLARINSCIVLDATRRKLPQNLTKRVSFLSAKFIDPGT